MTFYDKVGANDMSQTSERKDAIAHCLATGRSVAVVIVLVS